MKLSRYFFRRRDLLVVPVAYVCMGMFLTLFQDQFLYLPDARPFTPCPNLKTAEVISTGSFDGLYVPHGKDIAVVYHGNAGNACERAHYVQPLVAHGYAVLLVEYPGYAQVSGEPSDESILASADAVAMWSKETHPGKLVLIGESLGSGVAAYHAHRTPPEKLILITPYASLASLVARRVYLFPARLLLWNTYDTAVWAQNAPHTTIIVAEEDHLVPGTESDALYDALPVDARSIITIPGVGHNTLYDSPLFYDALIQVLSE